MKDTSRRSAHHITQKSHVSCVFNLFVLSTQHLSLAAEMGRNFAAVKWNGNRVDRAKLNMLKPIHDSLDLHITVLKKLYDRKVREDMRRSNA